MKRKIPLTYLLLFFFILGLINLPKRSAEKLQGSTVALLAPTWQHLLAIRNFFSSDDLVNQDSTADELQKLYLENTLLQTEIIHLKEKIHYEIQLLEQLKNVMESSEFDETITSLQKRNRSDLKNLLTIQLKAQPARVIFRSPISWNSTLWIDIGESMNEGLEKVAIGKNSPVLVGNSVIGVIDFVGKHQSRVKLITDSNLTPSVRVLRDETLLAKGEIHGTSKPLWRKQRDLLTGTGFNYDFSDDEGPARDLRTGKPIDKKEDQTPIPLLKTGDFLMTTGLDGIFPPNLLVAQVTKVFPLKEGDYFYELQAVPTVGNLDNLSLVFVLPPIGYDFNESNLSSEW